MNPQVEEKIVAACGTCGGQFRVSVKHAGKTIRCPKCANAMQIPMPGVMPPPANMAPPPQGMSAPPPMAGQRQQSSRRVALGGGLTRKIAQQSQRRGKPQGRRSGRDDRYGYQPKSGMSPTTLWSIIGGSLAVVLLIVIVVASGGGDDPIDPNNPTATPGTLGPDGQPIPSPEDEKPETPEEALARGIQELNETLENCGTPDARFGYLANFMGRLDDEFPPAMRDVWEQKVIEIAQAEHDDLFERADSMSGDDEDELEETRVTYRMRGLVWLADQLIRRFDNLDFARPYLEETLELAEGQHMLTQDMAEAQEQARERLGWQQIEIRYPDGSELDQAMLDGLLDELVNEWDGRWVSPEEFAEYEAIKGRAEEAALEIVRLWETDPFLARVHRTRLNLLNNIWFRDFDFEVHPVRPYALLLARHGTMTQEQYDQALSDRQQTLTNYWTSIEERYIEGWNLESSKTDDTPENPQPFIFINFANRGQLEAFYNSTNEMPLPEFARAYYNRQTEFVYYYDSEQYNPNDFNVVMHEATHQFFDRYSAEGIEDEYVRTHLFNEGMAEYSAGYHGDGRDPQFPGLNAMRIPGIVQFQQQLNGRRLPWGEDWCMWPVAYIWQPSNIPSLLYTGQHIAQQYERVGYGGNFLAHWQGIWHSFFYSYGWAFCYYMLEVSDYADEFAEYCRIEVADPERGGAELFCECMGWNDLAEELAEHPLHTLMVRTRGDIDWEEVAQVSVQRAQIMNRSEDVLRLQNDWFQWMLNGMIEEAREQGALGR